MLTVRLAQTVFRGYKSAVDSDREGLLQRVTAAQRRLRTVMAQDQSNPIFSVNLTMQQLRVLMLISATDGMALQQLGRQLGVSQATVSGIVDRLVAQDFVTRQEDPRDRRIRHIWLAPKGRTTLDEIMQQHSELEQRMLERLDDETLRMLELVLERVSAVLADLTVGGIQ